MLRRYYNMAPPSKKTGGIGSTLQFVKEVFRSIELAQRRERPTDANNLLPPRNERTGNVQGLNIAAVIRIMVDFRPLAPFVRERERDTH